MARPKKKITKAGAAKATRAEKMSDDFEKFAAGDYDFFVSEIDKMSGEAGKVEVFDATELVDPIANSSGSHQLDWDLVKAMPEGKYVEIIGDEGCGKTTLALEIGGQALKKGKLVLYVNMERNLDPSLLRSIRSIRPFFEAATSKDANVRKACPLKILQAPNGETAFNAAKLFAAQFPGAIIIIDSIDACVPEAELSGDIGDSKIGNLAKLMSQALRHLLTVSDVNRVTNIFINQYREKITMYGDPRTTSGGRAMRYYSSQRISLKKPDKHCVLKDSHGKQIGHLVRYDIIKNKCAPQGVEGAYPLLYNNGIFREHELMMFCIKFGVLKMGGKGGHFVQLPVLDDDGKPIEDEVLPLIKSRASQRLLIDSQLTEYLETEFKKLVERSEEKSAADQFACGVGVED